MTTEITGAVETSTRKIKVLVVDDERLIADTLAIILKQAHFEVAVAYSGEAAALSLNTFAPDVVLSDVMMPGLSGIELAMLVRDSRPECRVLLMSGQAATADLVERASSLGAHFEIHAKPMNPRILLGKLGKPFGEQKQASREDRLGTCCSEGASDRKVATRKGSSDRTVFC